jgi:post-segregation antitoxin (ccd killing protein)
VKRVEELGIPDLTTEQIETLCSTAEDAARKHILSTVPFKMVENLNISVEAEGTKPVNVTVEIDLVLSPKIKDLDAETLVNEAVKEALEASENYLRKLKWPSQK